MREARYDSITMCVKVLEYNTTRHSLHSTLKE